MLYLESKVTVGKHSFGENVVDLQGVLSGSNGGEKETFAGHGKSKVGYPATMSRFAEARETAFGEFSENLSNSRLVAAYKNPPAASKDLQVALAERPNSEIPTTTVVQASAVEV